MSSILPVLEKSWQYNVNQFLYAARGIALNAQQLLWTIKQSFIGSAQNPWTVVGSSDGVTGALDGVDRWTDSTKLVWGSDTAAHSWIVLHQRALGSAAQLLFECTTFATGNEAGMRCMFSPTLGFAGGSNTGRPTAVDEQGIMSNSGGSTSGLIPAVGSNMKVHFMQSADGKCTRLFVTAGRNLLLFAIFDTLADVMIPWSAPITYAFLPTGTSITLAYLADPNGPPLGIRVNGTLARALMTVEGFNANNLPNYFTLQNEVSQRWAMHPLGLANNNMPNIRGRLGRFVDLWAAPWFDPLQLISKRMGDMYPADGSRQFAQLGPLLVPWGGNDSPMTGKL